MTFFARESAQQCGPCTHGTVAMAKAFQRLAAGRPRPDDLERLHRYAEVTLPRRGACGHLDGATIAARTALEVFAGEIADHQRFGTCVRPAVIQVPGIGDFR